MSERTDWRGSRSASRGSTNSCTAGCRQAAARFWPGRRGRARRCSGCSSSHAGARRGEHGVLVTFAERPDDLIANVESFGWDLGGLVREGRLAIVDATPDAGRDRQRPLRSRRAVGAHRARARRDRRHAAVPRSDRRAVRGVLRGGRGAARVRRDAARAAAAGRDDADRRRAARRERRVTRYGAEEFVGRQRRPAAQRPCGGAPTPDDRGPQAARRRPPQGRVPVRHRRAAPASRSCRSPRSRAMRPARPSGSRSETPSWTRCAAAACTATR